MKEFKGTPGQWEANGLEVETEDYYICSVADFRLDERFDIFDAKAISEANAMLIAAAPELLELVISANRGVTGSHTAAWQEKAQAVIGKALGESQ